MKLVLFDIDGTLITQPGTELRFFKYLIRHRALGFRQIFFEILFAIMYFPRYGGHTLRKNKAYLAGLRVEEVARLAEDFVRDELSRHLISAAVSRMRRDLAAGDQVVLLSGTPQFIADPLARMLGAHAAVGALCATRNSVDGKHFVARVPPRHPLGSSKVEAARAIARHYDLPLSQAIAYGDSINDALLFREVGYSVAIMPDRKLRKLALGEGWEIVAG